MARGSASPRTGPCASSATSETMAKSTTAMSASTRRSGYRAGSINYGIRAASSMPRPYARLLGKLTNAALRKVGLEVRRIDSEALAAERALRNYEASGRIPWSEGYHVAHARLIATALDDS